MPSFHLSFWTHSGEAPRLLAFEEADLETAYSTGARKIAEALQRPDDFALLDRATGRFLVGAGILSRRGFYRLAVEEEGAPSLRRGDGARSGS